MKKIYFPIAAMMSLGGFNAPKIWAESNAPHHEKSLKDLSQPFFRTGFYAGGFVGNSYLKTKIANTYDITPVDNTLPMDFNNLAKSNNALEIGGTVGWKYKFSKSILAGINITLAKANHNKSINFVPHLRFNNSPFLVKYNKGLTITPALYSQVVID